MAGLFLRDASKRTTRWGITFDSGLEAIVAGDFDAIGVTGDHWAYHRPSGFPVRYEPDFTVIAEACASPACPSCRAGGTLGYLRLAQWVEVKPAEMLYAVRDAVGLPERFSGEHRCLSLTAGRLDEITGGELGKAKRLAEMSGREVLVVSALNRCTTLSLTLDPGGVTLSRCHPAVNHKQFLKDCDRFIRMCHWADQEARRRRSHEPRFAPVPRAQSTPVLRFFSNSVSLLAAKYPGRCAVCGRHRAPADIAIAHPDTPGARWLACCYEHL